MASHQLAIAKLTLSAGLIRPDPSSVSKDEIAHFHALLDQTLARCSPTNVQQCKRWMLAHIVQSASRLKSLGKYLTALSESFHATKTTTESRPSAKRKRLHLLYAVSDLLCHCSHSGYDRPDGDLVASTLQPHVAPLVTLAASFQNCPRHQARVRDVIDVWQDKKVLGPDFVRQLLDNVRQSQGTHSSAVDQPTTTAESQKKVSAPADAPFLLPPTHGDPSTPYYDLPAANIMPHVEQNSSQPINPQLVRPLQMATGPADGDLVMALKDFLKDVERMYNGAAGRDQTSIVDVDELGQPVVRDERTGTIIESESYYGWSRAFCEKMKKTRGRRATADDRHRGRSDSRGRSPSPRKRRRRHSDSDDDSRNRGRLDSYSRSPSRSHGPYQDSRPGRRRMSYSRPRSSPRRRSRSASAQRWRRRSRSDSIPHSRSRSRSRSYSPALGGDQLPPPPPPPLPPHPGTVPLPPYPGGFSGPVAPAQIAGVPSPAFISQLMAQHPHFLSNGFPMSAPQVLPNGQWVQPSPLAQAPVQSSAYPGSGHYGTDTSPYGVLLGAMSAPSQPPPPPPSAGPGGY